MNRLYIQVSKKIESIQASIDDSTQIIGLAIGMHRPNTSLEPISEAWRETAGSFSICEMSIVKNSLSIARNQLRITDVGDLRKVEFKELKSAPNIGIARASILKSFGDNSNNRLELSHFSVENQYPLLFEN